MKPFSLPDVFAFALTSPVRRYVSSIFLSLGLFALIGWGDYATSYEISLGPLYAIPVALVTWRINLSWGLVFSLFGAWLWYYVDHLTGYPYIRPWHAWERAGTVLVTCAFVAISFQIFKRVLNRERGLVKQMEGALPICSCCKRIQDSNGYWMELGSYLREHTEAQPQQKLCPDCARKQYLAGYSS